MYKTGIINQYGVFFTATDTFNTDTLTDCEIMPFEGNEAAFYQRAADVNNADLCDIEQYELPIKQDDITGDWLIGDTRGLWSRILLEDNQTIGDYISHHEV